MDLKKAAAAEMDQKGSKRKKNALTEATQKIIRLEEELRKAKNTLQTTRLNEVRLMEESIGLQ